MGCPPPQKSDHDLLNPSLTKKMMNDEADEDDAEGKQGVKEEADDSDMENWWGRHRQG